MASDIVPAGKSMVVTGGGFDLGPGLTLIFRCVPP
jgi:hypothetical protein